MSSKSSLAQGNAVGLAWMFSGRVVFGGAQIAAIMVLARLLSQEEIGAATIVLLLSQLGALIATCGLGQSIVQRNGIETRHISTAFCVAIVGGIVVGIGFQLFRDGLAHFFKMGNLGGALRWLSVLIPLVAVAQIAQSILQRERQFRLISTTESACFIVGYFIVSAALAASGFGAESLLAGQVVNYSGLLVTYLFTLRHQIKLEVHVSAFQDLFRLGAGFGLAELVGWLAQSLDKLLAAQFLGLRAVGVYGRAYALVLALTNLLTYPVNAVLFPAFSRVQGDTAKLRRLYEKSLSIVVILCFCPSVILVAAPDAVVEVLLGSEWLDAAQVLVYLGGFLFFRVAYRISDLVLRANGEVYKRLIIIVANCGMLSLGIVVGCAWGLEGLAIAVALSFVVLFFALAWIALPLVGLTWASYFASFVPVFVWGGLTAIVGHLITGAVSPHVPALVIVFLVSLLAAISLVFFGFFFPKKLFGSENLDARKIIMDVKAMMAGRTGSSHGTDGSK